MVAPAVIVIIVVIVVAVVAGGGVWGFRRWWVKRRNRILEENHNAARELAEAGMPQGPRVKDEFYDTESLEAGRFGRNTPMSLDLSRAQSPSGRSQYSFVLDTPKRPSATFQRSFSPSRLRGSFSIDREPKQTAEEFQEAAREQLRRKARENLSMYDSLSRPGSPALVAQGRSASPAASLNSVNGANVPSKWFLPSADEAKFLGANGSARNTPRASPRTTPRASPRPSMTMEKASMSLDAIEPLDLNAPKKSSRLRLQPSYAELSGRKNHSGAVDMNATMPPSPLMPPSPSFPALSSGRSSANSSYDARSTRSVSKDRGRSRSRSRSRGRTRTKSQPRDGPQFVHEDRAHAEYSRTRAPQLPQLSPVNFTFSGLYSPTTTVPKSPEPAKSPFDDPESLPNSAASSLRTRSRSPSPKASKQPPVASRNYELDTPVAPYISVQSSNAFSNGFSNSLASTLSPRRPSSPLERPHTVALVSAPPREASAEAKSEDAVEARRPSSALEYAPAASSHSRVSSSSSLSSDYSTQDTIRIPSVHALTCDPSPLQSFRFPETPARAHRPAPLGSLAPKVDLMPAPLSPRLPLSASTVPETPFTPFSFQHTPNMSASTMSSFGSVPSQQEQKPTNATHSRASTGEDVGATYFDSYFDEFQFDLAQEARSPKQAPRISFIRSSVGSIPSLASPDSGPRFSTQWTSSHKKTSTLSGIEENVGAPESLTDEQWKEILGVPSPMGMDGLGIEFPATPTSKGAKGKTRVAVEEVMKTPNGGIEV